MKIKKIITVCILSLFLLGSGFSLPSSVFAQSATNPSPSSALQGPNFQFDLGSITSKGINPTNWRERGINFLFERAIQIMAATIGSAAVLMMVVGGFMMIASAGREEMYTKGKAYVTKAAVGLVFVLGAYIIVTTIQLLIRSIF